MRYTLVYLVAVNNPQHILRQLASIDQMERGTLSVIRQTSNGPCCNFQRRENGAHKSEYIPADQVPAVEANLRAYQQFQSLVDDYVACVSERSRAQRLAGGKKKRPTPTSLSRRKPRSPT